MAYNKFIKRDGTVLLDLTNDTVAPETLVKGTTAHNRSGEAIEGTVVKSVPTEIDTLDSSLLTAENENKVYKCDGKLYQVNKVKSLKGLTIKFNKHITPCPVIGDDDVFECEGIIMGDDFYWAYGYRLSTTAIRKLANNTIVVEGEETNFIHYSEPDSMWMTTDAYGNTVNACAPPVIYNFDCPAFNENPDFIEWILDNAKVYPNFESPNEIKSFKLAHPFSYDQCSTFLQDALRSGMWEANRTGVVFEFDVDGHFTATFSVNGELVTKTFTNVNVDGNDDHGGLPIFSNGDDNLVFLFAVSTGDGGVVDGNGDLLASAIKYNDIYLEDEIEFTKFDCILNTKTDDILSFILCYTTVNGEYHNGFAFKEYNLPIKEYNGTVEVE